MGLKKVDSGATKKSHSDGNVFIRFLRWIGHKFAWLRHPILRIRGWFGIAEQPDEVLGNRYEYERAYEKQSKIRLRGRLWFQTVTFALYEAVAVFAAVFIGTFSKTVWYLFRSGLGNLALNSFGIYFKPVFSFDYLKQYIDFSLTGGVFQDNSWVVWLLMAIGFGFFTYLGLRNWYDWVQKFNDRTINRNRFTEIKELDRTYEFVPDRNKFYDLQAGMPISHLSGYSWTFFRLHPILAIWQWIKGFLGINREVWGPNYQKIREKLQKIEKLDEYFARQLTVSGGYTGFYYIDSTPTHEVVIGATRAGKDQLLGYILIDLLRRGANPPNVIDTDAKNEDGKMAFLPLKKAGFDVQLLNIADTDWSETWNPFQVALDYAKDGELDKARDEAMVVVQIIGASESSDSEHGVWDSTAEDTQLAIILILIWLAIEHDDETLATPASLPQFINSVNKFSDPKDKNLDGLTQYFNMLRKLDPIPPIINEAILKAGSYLGSQGDTKASIMFTLQSRISLFASETVARLTSRSTIRMADYGFPRMFKATVPIEYVGATAKVELYNMDDPTEYVEQDAVKVSRSGVISYPFHHKFSAEWMIRVHFDDLGNSVHLRNSDFKIFGERRLQRNFDRTIKVDSESKLPLYKIVTNKKVFNLLSNQEATFSLRYSEKPTAMFLVTPQNNDNYAAIASLFLGQVFSINTQIASEVTRRKMDRRIVYKLNEFSMFPRIPGFDNFLTRGLTYGHIVVMYVQDESQIGKHYSDKEVSEIKNNMMTSVLIQTKDMQTNKDMSERLGNIEIQKEMVNSQMGTQQQDRGNRQMSIESIPLLSPKELEEMNNREMIVLRQAKRTDKHGRSVRPLPIFNTAATLMPNTRDLVGNSYRLDYYTTDLRIKNNTKHLSYEDMFQDFTGYFYELSQQVGEEIEQPLPAGSSTSSLADVDLQDMMNNHDVQIADNGENMLTDAEIKVKNTFLKWKKQFDQERDKPFLTMDELLNPHFMLDVEKLIAQFITKKYDSHNTDEQGRALTLAKQGMLFKTIDELNNNQQMLNLFGGNSEELYELTKYLNIYRQTGEMMDVSVENQEEMEE